MSRRCAGTGFVLAGALLCACDVGGAGMVTYTFSGELDFVDPAFEFRFSPGDSFAGSFSLDPDAPLASDSNAIHFYPTPVSVLVGGYSFSSGIAYTRMNNDQDGLDYVELQSENVALTTPLPGFLVGSVGLFLGTEDTTLFDGTWPDTIPPLTEFEYRSFTMYFEDNAISGSITSFSQATPTPEPSTLVLAVSGCAIGLIRFGRRRLQRETTSVV